MPSELNDFLAQMDAKEAALNAADAAAKAKGEIVGRYITHAYADSAAYYTIVSATKTRATIQVADIGDGWVLPAWGKRKTLARSAVEAFLYQRDAMTKLFTKNEDYFAALTPGQILHVSHSNDSFIRCEVVATPNGNWLKQVALVGNWSALDLPRWTSSGEAYFPYHPEKVREGTLCQPHESNIWENKKGQAKGDPRKLAPISLDLPERTAEQSAEQAVCAKWNAVKKALELERGTGDTYAAAMERAKTLLLEG